MKRFTKIVSLLLCLVLAASLCACGDGETTKPASTAAADDMSKHENIKWYIRYSQPERIEEVMQAANEYLGEKLNVTLDLQCIEVADYNSKIQLALAAGEEFDITWTAAGANPYESNVTKGAFLALDEYLELPELAELKNYYSDGIWDAVRVGGKIYGIPMEQIFHTQQGYTFIKSISDKYGISERIQNMAWVDDDNHGTMEEMEEIYDIVRAGEPSDFAISVDGVFDTFDKQSTQVKDYYIADGKVTDFSDKLMERAVRARRWNQKGYFPADAATMDNADAYKNAGKVYSVYSRYLPGVAGKFQLTKGYEAIVIPTSDAVIGRYSIQSTISAISSTCSNPVRALKLLNLLNHDQYLLNLLCYGIEGEDFTRDPATPHRMERTADSFYIPEFMIGSQFLAYLAPSYEDGVWEETKKENNEAAVDPNIGFCFDYTPVESEIAQVGSVLVEYNKIISFGLDDPEIIVPEREKKCQLAGKKVVMDEIQRQYDAWLKTKK